MRYSPAIFILATAAMALPANLKGETSAAAHEATVENDNQLLTTLNWYHYKRDNQAAHEATVENENIYEFGEGWIDVKRDNQAAQ